MVGVPIDRRARREDAGFGSRCCAHVQTTCAVGGQARGVGTVVRRVSDGSGYVPEPFLLKYVMTCFVVHTWNILDVCHETC